jgi:tripeptidyl-peptidase-1
VSIALVKMLIPRSALIVLLAVVEAAIGSPVRVRSPYAVKDTHNVPRKWSRIGPAPSDHVIHLQIGLKQSQFDELERHLYEGIWDPTRGISMQKLTKE